MARPGDGVMRVVRLRAPGGPEQLALEEADRPRPGPGEALVRVHAAAITRGELEWPLDRLPAIPCYELSGVVEEVGPGVAGAAGAIARRERRDTAARTHRLARAVRPRPARRWRARPDPRCRRWRRPV